jgi:hypothetical protein
VAVTGEDHVDPELPQDRHDVARVPQDVHVAPGTRDGKDVVVNDEYLRSPIPAPELRVEPGVVLSADLPLVEIRLGRVDRHDLGLALRQPDHDGPLAHPEEFLEVPVADVPGIVVAGDHDHVRALQAFEVSLDLLELPPVTLHREVARDGDEVRQEGVGLLDRGQKQLGPEEARSHVNVRYLRYFHLGRPLLDYGGDYAPYEGRLERARRRAGIVSQGGTLLPHVSTTSAAQSFTLRLRRNGAPRRNEAPFGSRDHRAFASGLRVEEEFAGTTELLGDGVGGGRAGGFFVEDAALRRE